MMEVGRAVKAIRDEEMQAEIEDFLEGFNQPTYRALTSVPRGPSSGARVGRCAETLKLHDERQREDRDRDR